MSKRIRTFIAVEIDAAQREALIGLQDELRAMAHEVKWVEPENLHLTLKFLGDVDETELYAVCKMAERAVVDVAPIQMSLSGVGAFPNADRPRIIWVGIQDGSDKLVHIHAALDEALGAEGYPREARAFTPHLTLGRARQPGTMPKLAGAIRNLAYWEGGSSSVREIVVMSSELSPQGPSYSVMGRGRLAAR